jgi:hypothetical protein
MQSGGTMKVLAGLLVLMLAGIGCARIYRPVEVAPIRTVAPVERLTGAVALQPWGDNSRYEEKAHKANLRVLVLCLENQGRTGVDVLGLEVPAQTTVLRPDEALLLVKQQPLLFLLYPLLPGLMIPGAETKGSFGPSDQAAFSALAFVGLAIGVPNAVVAARSNARLGAFFQNQAWSSGPLESGQRRQGLLFLRSPDPYAPLTLQIRYQCGSEALRLALVCPGLAPR